MRYPRTLAISTAFVGPVALIAVLGFHLYSGAAMAQPNESAEERNRKIVAAAFEAWRNGTGSVFDLLDLDAQWTITGSSPMSKTYTGRQQFLDEVITPFGRRISAPLEPDVRGLYADGDTVVIVWDGATVAKDGKPYRNTYVWVFEMKDGRVRRAVAFFDTVEFDDLWTRLPG